MKNRIALVAALMTSALLAPWVGQAQDSSDAPPQVEQVYLILLRKGPSWTPGESPELAELQKGHLAHLTSLGKSGHAALAGPVEDRADGTLHGIIIMRAASFEEAVALESADPAVKAGRLRVEAHPLWLMKGTLPAPTTGK